MNTHKKLAIVVGLLFIAASTTAVISLLSFAPIIDSDLEDPDYFNNISEKEDQIIIAGLFGVLLVVSVIAIAVLMYPILKQDSETVALGYISARSMEAVIIAIGLIAELSIFGLSQDYSKVNAPDASTFQTVGKVLLDIYRWTDMLGPVIIFGITALILNYSFYRSKIVPRFISIWGFIGGILIIMSGVISMFGDRSIDFLWAAPIAINEMFLAVWLIVKGFNLSELDHENTK